MSAVRIAIKRGATLSRSAIPSSAFSANGRVVSGLLSDPAAAAALSPLSPGPFLYSNQRGFVKANGKGAFKYAEHVSSIWRKENEEFQGLDKLRLQVKEIRKDLLHYSIATVVWVYTICLVVLPPMKPKNS